MVDNIEKMENLYNSIGYYEKQNEFEELLGEQKYRHFWQFLYSSRHAQQKFFQSHEFEEYKRLTHGALDLLKKFHPKALKSAHSDVESLAELLERFCLGVTYAFHRNNVEDGFNDIRIEPTVPQYSAFMDSLSQKEMDIVKRLHELTHEYGFPIMQLWLQQHISEDLMNEFISSSEDGHNALLPYFFIFVKKSSHPKGIQISISGYKHDIDDSWDLKIFFCENDKISHIKKSVDEAWDKDGIQTIGGKDNHFFALYIDRNSCSKNNALSFLDLQNRHLSNYFHSPLISPSPSTPNTNMPKRIGKSDINNATKELERQIQSLRKSEDITYRRWNRIKNNIRRSIGLFLWDQNHEESEKSRKSQIRDIIDHLKSNSPQVLELYLSNYNTPISPKSDITYGDQANAQDTVIRLMEDDYYLTDYCINQSDYFSPEDVKNANKRVT